ncbi:MAG: hypothetical protein WCI27_02505 [Candidatus Omnitrophota bacterium]
MRQIHSCQSSLERLQGEEFYIVRIEYGSAQDCPAGCFYEHFLAAVKADKSAMIELPGPTAEHIVSLLYAESPFRQTHARDYQCLGSLESLTEVKAAKDDGHIGWQIKLARPYECSWFSGERTTVTQDNKLVHTGRIMKKFVNGSVFVYLDNNAIRWGFDKLVMRQTEGREETRIDVITKK